MRVFAPAKINLYLHVTKRLANGYHALDSLIAFADIGDEIGIIPSSGFSFSVDGPMAGALHGRDLDSSPQSSNLVVKAAWRLAQAAERSPDVAITLTKNLPAGGGIGGGSSDAAAVIWGLCQLWDIPRDAAFVKDIMIGLGADVPVCFEAMAARVKGIGDVFEPAPPLPETPIVLAYPGKPCSTVDVFRSLNIGDVQEQVALPDQFETHHDLVHFLSACKNDLLVPAIKIVPDIDNVLREIEGQEGCSLARMSGSGSCCFGLFDDEDLAARAALAIRDDNPDWWVRAGYLGRVERY